MIRRWMSEVPSSISSSFASRIHFSTGSSREYPQPPSVCTAAHVHHMAVSDACSFAIAASRVTSAPAVSESRRTPDEKPRRVDSKSHVGEAERDRLMPADRPPELLARLRIVDGVLESCPGEPGCSGRERDPGQVERPHQATKAFAFLSETAVGRHLDVEEQLRVDDRALPHLAHRWPDLEPGIPLLEDERGDPLRAGARIDGGEDHVEGCRARARDPALLPPQHVAAGCPGRRRLNRCGIRSDTGLRDRERAERRAFPRQWLDPATLLLLVSEHEDRLGREAVRRDQIPDPGAAEAELLLYERLREQIGEAAAADVLGQHERRQPERCRPIPDLPRHLDVCLVDRLRDRSDLAKSEVAAERLDLALLRSQVVEAGRHRAILAQRLSDGTAETGGDTLSVPDGDTTRNPSTRSAFDGRRT